MQPTESLHLTQWSSSCFKIQKQCTVCPYDRSYTAAMQFVHTLHTRPKTMRLICPWNFARNYWKRPILFVLAIIPRETPARLFVVYLCRIYTQRRDNCFVTHTAQIARSTKWPINRYSFLYVRNVKHRTHFLIFLLRLNWFIVGLYLLI